ncbi:CDP-alcohol phosphatidyltransferase family protein, partial [Burkholderia multivorans]
LQTDPGGTYPYLLAGSMLASLVLLNKALNDMVHVSRAFNGLDKLADSQAATALNPGFTAKLKRAARFVPFHRIYHSVELSLLALVSSIVTAIIVPLGAAPLSGERWLVLILVPLCLLSVIGHFMSIMASKRLS